MEEKNPVVSSEETLRPTEGGHDRPLVDNEHQAGKTEHEESSAFSNKTWSATLISCIPIASICFLVWLDEVILATAIPRISEEFQSFDQIAWYGPSYLFGLCASQLLFGRLYKDLPPKIIYVISLVVFEVASIIQAAAPSSPAFIVGRVLAGTAGSGVLTGSLTIFSAEIPKAKLPYVMGTFAWIHVVASISGPVVGGAITSSSLTWRWCFWINPIVSVVAAIPVVLVWKGKLMPERQDDRPPFKTVLLKLDYVGLVVFAAAAVAILLALQFGGSTYTWSDGRTIASITIGCILFLVFIVFQYFKGDNALVPSRIVWTRTVMLSSIYTATLDGAYFILTYQLPLWFQSVSGLSARDSGYHIVPLLACCILAAMTGTTLTGKFRYYQPFMLLGAILLAAGSAVLTMLRTNDSAARWVVGEILAGAGTGLGSPLPLLAVQNSLQSEDVSIGYGIVLMAGYLGSSIALAIAQAVFASRLRHDIYNDLAGLDPSAIINAGAVDLMDLVPQEQYPQVLQSYNSALTQAWYISVALAGTSVPLVLGYKWKKMDMRDRK